MDESLGLRRLPPRASGVRDRPEDPPERKSSSGGGNDFVRKARPPRGLPPEEPSEGRTRRRQRSRSRASQDQERRRRRRRSSEDWSLGATHGAVAYGAWAARIEIANMLEKKCDPGQIIELVDKGIEGEAPLRTDNESIPRFSDPVRIEDDVPSGGERPRRPLEPSERFGEEKIAAKLFPEMDVEEVVEEQRAIMNALATKGSETPPWAHKDTNTEVKTAVLKVEQVAPFGNPTGDPSFRKRAQIPADSRDTRKFLDLTAPERNEEKGEETEAEAFAKGAKPPPEGVHVEKAEIHGRGSARPKTAEVESLAEKERLDLEKFKMAALEIFKFYKVLDINMELSQWVGDMRVDEAKFIFHVAPSRASTGLRYANLMNGHMSWLKEIPGWDQGSGTPLEKLRVVEYVENVVQNGMGRYTPSSFLFALDYFSKAFGFDPTGAQWRRSKMLAARYSKAKPGMADRAPQFSKETLLALEQLVLDDLAPTPERVAAGKLRLCCQASVRYDDLLHTPLSALEWVRRKGEVAIVGVRARTTQGKVRARPWVASFMGASDLFDKWLSTLIKLVVSSHGRRWGADDHFGKEVNRAGDGFTAKPARMEPDVIAVKSGLSRLLEQGENVGLSKVQISMLRWHGAKSTFTSLMQHLQLDPRMIRLAGDWSSREDAMPDVYLREAQLLCLKGQEKCLYHLRLGGDFGGLVPVGLAGEGFPDEGGVGSEGAKKVDLSKAEVFEGVHASTLSDSFLDGVFDQAGTVCFDLVDEDKNFKPEEDIIDRFLEDAGDFEDSYPVYDFEKPKPKAEPAGDSAATVTVEEKDLETPPMLEEDKGEEDEGLTCSFVVAASGAATSKLHLPAVDKDSEGRLLQVAVPLCGLRGSFTYVGACEAIDPKTAPCVRCFGRRDSSCGRLCKYTLGDAKRCTRRCAADCSASGIHLCHVHE